MSESITTKEAARLAELEKTIETNVALVGKALFEIREGRLYRATHKTFEEYCQTRFAMDRKYINKQIQAAAVIDNLTPMGVIPQNERQARPLAKLPPDKQPEAWEKAQEKAKEEGKPLAARHVEDAVNETLDQEPIVVDGTKNESRLMRRPSVKIIESEGMRIWTIAKGHLERINKHDEFREKALTACIEYCQNRIKNKK